MGPLASDFRTAPAMEALLRLRCAWLRTDGGIASGRGRAARLFRTGGIWHHATAAPWGVHEA